MYKENALPYKKKTLIKTTYAQIETLNAFAGITSEAPEGVLNLLILNGKAYLIGLSAERFAACIFKVKAVPRLENACYTIPSSYHQQGLLTLQVTPENLINLSSKGKESTIAVKDFYTEERLANIIKGIRKSVPLETPSPIPQLNTHYEALSDMATYKHLKAYYAPSYIVANTSASIVHALFPLKNGLIVIRPLNPSRNLPTISADLIMKNL